MTKSQQRKFLINLALRFTVLFTIVIIVLSIAGLILARINSKEHEITKILTNENPDLSRNYLLIQNPGLPYSYLLVLACIVFIITLITFLVEYMIKRNKNRYDALFKKNGIYRKKKMT
jgi:heme/copper-type cytochrome/quinol oxidase subunit 4